MFLEPTPSSLIHFLDGKWNCSSLEISASNGVVNVEYLETMIAKDCNTLVVAALGAQKEIRIVELGGGMVRMIQGNFSAVGYREGNSFFFAGQLGRSEIRIRLHRIADRFVLQRETWINGTVVGVDVLHLTRATT